MEPAESAWTIDRSDYPRSGSPMERLRFALRYSVLAPSSHNSQPWLFRIRGGSVDLIADRSRALPVVDSDDRELIMSCGAALHHLVTALSAFGERVNVERWPDDADPDLLASVTVDGQTDADPDAFRRLLAMTNRRTTRFSFEPGPPPPEVAKKLAELCATEGAELFVASPSNKEALADLVCEADREQLSQKAFRRELASWIHPNRAPYRDGIPGYAQGISDVMSAIGPLAIRMFDMGERQAEKSRDLVEHSPLLAVIATNDDTPRSWLNAGSALSSLLLEATDAGLAASFLNQPIEVEDLRAGVAEIVGAGRVPQLLLRLGYHVGPALRPTPRRDVADVLV